MIKQDYDVVVIGGVYYILIEKRKSSRKLEIGKEIENLPVSASLTRKRLYERDKRDTWKDYNF